MKHFLKGCIIASTLMISAVSLAACKPMEAASAEVIEIYAPASTSSIPFVLAASQSDLFTVTLYNNQSQANTLFIRGEIPLFVTGLSVGQDLYKQEVPIQLVNSYVSGLSSLVTFGEPINSFNDLKGKEVYVPFQGSPIEDISAYFAAQQGLSWEEDIQPVYAPFESSVALLKEGKAAAVVLPEPFVSLLEGQENIHISISYYDEWNKNNPGDQGYPQVGMFVNTQWAAAHAQEIELINQSLQAAIRQIETDPAAAVEAVSGSYSFPPKILLNSLARMQYDMISGRDLQQQVERYDSIIGKPQDEIDAAFYYLPAK